MNENRYNKQLEAFNIWIKTKRGTFNLCTGFGKTYLSIMIIDYMYKILKNEYFFSPGQVTFSGYRY